jgi:hypothetical protein
VPTIVAVIDCAVFVLRSKQARKKEKKNKRKIV